VDDLTIMSQDSILEGEKLALFGGSGRRNGTSITIKIDEGNATVTKTAGVSGQNTHYASGTYLNTNYSAPSTGCDEFAPFSCYNSIKINATDGIVSVTKNVTVASKGFLNLTRPQEPIDPTGSRGLEIAIGTSVDIEGQTNRGNGTAIDIWASEYFGRVNKKLMATSNLTGGFNATWNTTGYPEGVYTLFAQPVISISGFEGDVIWLKLVAASVASTTTSTSTTSSTAMPTTSTTTSTTVPSSTTSVSSTTSTTPMQCSMAGNYEPCDTVTLSEIVGGINQWTEGKLTIIQMIGLINSWSNPAEYPPN